MHYLRSEEDRNNTVERSTRFLISMLVLEKQHISKYSKVGVMLVWLAGQSLTKAGGVEREGRSRKHCH